jgi:hypothetical protein
MVTASRALTPPSHSEELDVAFPIDHVLLLTFNRPQSLNAMTPRMKNDLDKVLDWFVDEPQLWYVQFPLMTAWTENEGEKR